jgi:outer membrane protein assembly factor BamB
MRLLGSWRGLKDASRQRQVLSSGPRLLALGLCALGAIVSGFPSARAQGRAEFVPTFSTNTRVRQQVDRLNRLSGQKLWDEWLATYQQLVDDPEDPVLVRDEEFLVGVRYHCHQLLAGLPVQVRQRYRALYDGEARKVYDKAAAERDAAGMREVYSRYRFSTHASRALQWLADRALDEGRPEYARVAYSRLAKEPTVSAATLLRYVLAADAAGRPEEARSVLERVRKDFGGQPLQVGGQNTTAAAACDQIAKSLKRAAAPSPARRWPSFTGDNGDRKMKAVVSGTLERLWDYRYPTSTDSTIPRGGHTVIIGSGYSIPRSRFGFLTFPSVVGDRLWVQGPRNLTALNPATGQPLWERQDFILSQADLPSQNQDPRMGGVWYRSGRPVQAAPAAEGHILVSRMPLAAGEREGGRWPADFALGAFDARSGAPLWRKVAGGDPRGLYFNLPALQGNIVFSGIATFNGGITEYRAVAMDAGSGEPLWTTYLGAGSDPLASTDGSPAAVRDGLVWIESSLYTLNVLDLLTGEIRLIYHYDPARRVGFQGGIDSTPQVTNEPISAIAFAGKRVVDKETVSPVIFVPRWGTMAIALNAENGRHLWSSPKSDQSSMGSLCGVDDQHVYVGGDQIQAINIGDDAKHLLGGAREWTWKPQAPSTSVGFAALSGDRIYVPVENRIHVRSAADGRELEVLDLSADLGDSPGFTSVLVLDGMLLVSTRDRLLAFSPKL